MMDLETILAVVDTISEIRETLNAMRRAALNGDGAIATLNLERLHEQAMDLDRILEEY